MLGEIKMSQRECAGMTLIEILVSVTLTISIISILMQAYLANQKSQRLQMTLRYIQDDMMTLNHIFKSEIHLAGYIGCGKLTADFPIVSHINDNLTVDNQIENGMDELTVRHLSQRNAILLNQSQQKEILTVSKSLIFSPGDVIIISDCKQAEITKVKQVYQKKNEQILLLIHPLQKLFTVNAEIGLFEKNRFYIAKTTRQHVDHSPVYAIFVETILGKKIELLENVKKMQVILSKIDDHIIGIDMRFNLDYPIFNKTIYLYVSH